MGFLVFIWCCLLSTLPAVAQDQATLVFAPGMQRVHVMPIFSLDNRNDKWLDDAILSGAHDPAFIRKNDWMALLGFPQNPQVGDFWIYFDIDNRSGEDVGLISDTSTTPNLTRIFIVDRTTRAIKRSELITQDLARTNKVFTVPSGDWRIYFELKPDDFSLPIIAFDLKSMNAMLKNAPERYFLSLSYGICLALITYNFILALLLRNRAHFIYIAYTISVLLYYEGRYQLMAEQFGIPVLPKWSLMIINSSTSFLFLSFSLYMLNIRKNMPIWIWPMAVLFLVWPFLIVYSFIDLTTAQRLLLRLLLWTLPLTVAVGIHSIVKKVPGAKLLFASTILPAAGTFVHFARSIFSQWLPMSVIDCAQMLALDVEMILLSMTIGFKLNREQEFLRNKIDHAYTELKTIVYPHQVEQIWNGRQLSETMPLGEKNAFILVFDVVASSKMQIADPRGFLSRLFRDCAGLMMDNYEPERMTANGYRVKEMGDGFLCSVDFPFACPDGNPADHSVRMAHRFLEIFRWHVSKLQTTQRIHCSIGVAYGPVQAFYPESGAQVYDLFGRGIILAHRYESMRDILFRWLKQKDDIIILHRPVYDQLSKELREEFTEVDLTTSDFKVRDDEEALTLYYQLASGRTHRKLLRGA